MTGNNKKINPPEKIPLLSPADIEERERRKELKLRRWYKIYIATTACVALITIIFIIVGICENKIAEASGLDSAAAAIISDGFMDLSGNAPPYNKDEIKDKYNGIFDVMSGILSPTKNPDDSQVATPPTDGSADKDSIYDFDYSKIPEGETAIIPMDLSLSSQSADYIYNSTGYSPNTKALLAAALESVNSPTYITSTDAPLALILHTHGTEGYSESNAISYRDDGSEIARSENTSENVVTVGAVLAETLNKNGIPTLHCSIMHDQIQYKDSYSRAEETIKQYLEKYPSIKLVIDLHRDAVIKSTGELVRPVTEVNSEPVAQVMCVVGSDWGGDPCPGWESNLSLALKLREALNKKYGNLCRPTYLRSSTYNQELAPYSLLLEVGACGNSLEEAKKAALLVATELVPLIRQM